MHRNVSLTRVVNAALGEILSIHSFTDIWNVDWHIWPDRFCPRNTDWCVLVKACVGDELILFPALWTLVGGGEVHPLTGRTSWASLWRGDKHLIGQHTVRLSPIR